MKKFFALLVTLLVMTFCVKAQTFLYEGFEAGVIPAGWTAIDNDGDGYNWGITSGSNVVTFAGNGCIASASYDNYYGELYPDNWLITPAVELTADATLTFHVVGQDPNYASENYTVYISTTGNAITDFTTTLIAGTTTSVYDTKTVDLSDYTGETVYIAFRHHNTSDEFRLNLDEVKIFADPGTALVEGLPSSVDFGNVILGDSAATAVTVGGYYLTDNITATTSDPFLLTTDGAVFSYSVTLPSTGGTLYVVYVPSMLGEETGSVSLSSGSASATIDLTGTGFSCDNTQLPLYQGFEDISALACWTPYTMGTNSISLSAQFATEGTRSLMFSSYVYDDSGNYDQYMITPKLPMGVSKMVSFDYRSYDANFIEKFKVGYSTADVISLNDFTWGPVVNVTNATDWMTYVNAAIPDDAQYIAILYCTGACYYYLYVDNFSVSEVTDCMSPVSVNASNITQNSASINWNPVGTETAWDVVVVEHGEDPNTGYSEYTDVRPYLVENLSPNTQYDAYVMAECESGSSTWSAAATFTTTPDCSNPTAPVVTDITGTSAVISWNAAPYGVTSYTVEYGVAESGSTEQEVVEDATTVTLTGLEPQTDYEFTITSVCNSETLEPTPVAGTFTTGCLVVVDFTIGNGTSTNSYLPSNSYYKYSYTQQIFLASELNGQSMINSLSFEMGAVVSQRNIQIYLMHTSATNSTSFLPATNAQLVYSGSQTMVTGWNTYNFNTPFQYNGTDNLALIIVDMTGSWTSGNNAKVHDGPSDCSRYIYQDESAYSTDTIPTSGTSSSTISQRLNVKFGECDESSTCVAPIITDFTFTATEATITWSPGYQESAWTLEYKADSDADWTDAGSVSSPYTITNLIPDNDYQIRLYSDCGGGELSTPAMRAFTTPCAAIVPPFTEDFSGWDTNPSACWSRYSGLASSVFTGTALSSVTDGWVFDRDNEFSGFPLGHPIVNVYGTSCNYWLVSPAIDLTGMENPELTFDLALTDYNNADPIEDPTAQADDKFMVVVSTDNGATWSQANATIWDNAGSIKVYNSISSQGEEITIPLADYIDQTIMIAFYAESTVSNGDNDLHITNVHVGERAACAKPQVIMLDSATASELSFSWVPAGDEDAWQYVCLPQGTEISEDADWQFAHDTFAVVEDLDANTLYTIYVKAYCNDGEQSEAKTLNVRTECGQINVPFYESFESFSASYGAPIYCWTKETDYVYGDYPNVCTDAAATGTKSLFFYADYGYYNLIVTPQFESTVDLSTLEVALNMKSNGMVSLLVGVMTDPNDINTFVTVDTMHVTNTSDWNFNEVSLTSYTGTGSYIALKYVSSSYDGLYVDDINIDLIPTCPRPTQFVAESTPNDTVLLSWVDAEGDLWDVIYGPTGFDPETLTDAVLISGIEETSYAVDGLTAGVYDFYVRRDCGSGEVSPWSFSPATASPYTVIMGVTGSGSATGCGMTILDNGGVNGNYSSNCNYYLTVYPSDPDSLVAVSGTLIAESSSFDYLVIYDGTSQSPANELYHSTQTSGTPVTVGPVVSTEGPVTIYFHSDGSNEYAGFVLNVNCVAAPTCRKPINIAVSNITTSSADISWTAVGTGSSWNIEYGPAGFTQGQGTTEPAPTNPFTLTGLDASTNYDFYVQSDCGGDGFSDWSARVSFATECDIITVPYAENFDNYTTTASSSTVPSTYPNDVMPICWSFLNRSNSSSDYPNVFISSYSSYAVSGNCLFFKSSETTPVYSVLPEFSNEISDLALTFSYRNEGVSEYNGTLYAGYLTDPSDAATFTAVDTCPQTTTLTSIQNVTFANAPAGSRIAFKYAGGNSSNYYLSIDNVIVDINTTPPTPTCDVPTNLASNNVLYNSANITWNAGGSESAWNLQWRAQGGTWTPVNNLTAANYDLSGLTAQTTYEVQVQAVCDGGTPSDWSASHTFTTPAAPVDPCNVPTNLHVDNITANAATVTWNAGGSETSWEVQYKAQGSGSWQHATAQAATYTMEGLTPETTYEVKVKAICSADNQSDFVSTTFNTIATGIDNVTLANSISLMPNPADNYVVLTVNGNINVNEAAVYNAFGQKVQEIQLTDNQARIDLTNMASGMYFVRVAGDNAMATKKFIKK